MKTVYFYMFTFTALILAVFPFTADFAIKVLEIQINTTTGFGHYISIFMKYLIIALNSILLIFFWFSGVLALIIVPIICNRYSLKIEEKTSLIEKDSLFEEEEEDTIKQEKPND